MSNSNKKAITKKDNKDNKVSKDIKDLYPDFKPNITPKKMFEMGVFGGTYFRPIHSSITNKNYKNVWKKYSFLKSIPDHKIASSECNVELNKYKVNAGTSLEYWENQGWIKPSHPYGWIQWYCDFYEGKRSDDDERQIKRWLALAGPKGRFRTRLVNMVKAKYKHKVKHNFNDYSISPKIRQTLLHWCFELTTKDFE